MERQAQMSSSGFVQFNRTGHVGPDHDMARHNITIQKPNNTIRLPLWMIEELGNPTHFVFLHNNSTNEIAFKPADATDPDAYRLRMTGRASRPSVVAASGFLRSI